MSYISQIRALRPFDLHKDHKSGLTEEEFRTRCSGSPIWHSVDLGDLFIEGRRKNSQVLAHEMRCAALPDLRGKSVLDIGAFTGWYSFEAERRGAAHVVALDYYSWAVDWPKLTAYMAEQKAAGRIGDPHHPPAHILDDVRQPGRLVFDVTKEVLHSKVDPVLSRIEEYNPEHRFDVVFYLGVLYHSENPFSSLQKVASLTGERLIIETLGIYYPDLEHRPLWEFFADDSINRDITTWWAPTEKALIDMLKAVGFKNIDITCGADHLSAAAKSKPGQIRIWAHATR